MILLYVGLVAGAAAGWVGHLTGDTTQEQADLVGRIYPFLITLIPLVLILQVLLDWRWDRREGYATPAAALGHLALAGFGGGFLAQIAYVAIATQIPAVFGSAQAVDIMTPFFEERTLGDFLVVALITMAAGLVAGGVAHWRGE